MLQISLTFQKILESLDVYNFMQKVSQVKPLIRYQDFWNQNLVLLQNASSF